MTALIGFVLLNSLNATVVNINLLSKPILVSYQRAANNCNKTVILECEVRTGIRSTSHYFEVKSITIKIYFLWIGLTLSR